MSGNNYGNIQNTLSLSLSMTQKLRDDLYKLGVNSVSSTQEGILLNSEKTYITKESAFSRIHTRTLFNHIEREGKRLSRNFIFEDNSHFTRNNIKIEIERLLKDVKSDRGLEAFKVDVSGNMNDIIIDVYVKPLYVAEFIQMRISNSGNNIISDIKSGSL